MSLCQIEPIRQWVIYELATASAAVRDLSGKPDVPKSRCSSVPSLSSRYPKTSLPAKFVTCFGGVDVSLEVFLSTHVS